MKHKLLTLALTALACIVVCIVSNAQTLYYGSQEVSLSEEQKKELELRVRGVVDEFVQDLGYIANSKSSEKTKDDATEAALSLLIGEGDPYRCTDIETGQRYTHEAVQMQTSSKNSPRKRRQPVKSYLRALRNMIYTDILIEQADVARVSSIRKTGSGQYECVASFCQRFVGYRGDNIAYQDVTCKKVQCYIKKVECPDPSQDCWEVLLGDMSVVSTE